MIDSSNNSKAPHTRYSVTIRYDNTEDRLLFYCSHNSHYYGLIYLTRRITGNLIQGIMKLLSSGGPELMRVPAGLQQEVLHFEHQSALAQAAISQAAQVSIASKPPNISFLVAAVNASQTPEKAYILSWVGTQNQAITMTMSRLDLHCLTHVLQQHAQACGWDLPALPRWMEQGDGQPDQPLVLS